MRKTILRTPEGVSYVPRTLIERDASGEVSRVEVSITALLPNGEQHTVTLVPSTATGEGEGTGNVFVHLDDEPITHFAWAPPPAPKPLSLADMKIALVSLDGAEIRGVPAFLSEYRWNGWECPYFLPWTLRQHRAQFEKYAELCAGSEDSMRVSWNEELDLPSIISVSEDGDEEQVSVVTTETGATLVTVGYAFFTWFRTNHG